MACARLSRACLPESRPGVSVALTTTNGSRLCFRIRPPCDENIADTLQYRLASLIAANDSPVGFDLDSRVSRTVVGRAPRSCAQIRCRFDEHVLELGP